MKEKIYPFKRFNVFPTLLCYSIDITGKAADFAERKTQKMCIPY